MTPEIRELITSLETARAEVEKMKMNGWDISRPLERGSVRGKIKMQSIVKDHNQNIDCIMEGYTIAINELNDWFGEGQ